MLRQRAFVLLIVGAAITLQPSSLLAQICGPPARAVAAGGDGICFTAPPEERDLALGDGVVARPPQYPHVRSEALVRIYVHRTIGPSGVPWTDAEIDVTLDRLRADFAPGNIRFLEVGRDAPGVTQAGFDGDCQDLHDLTGSNRLDIFFINQVQNPVGCDNDLLMNGFAWGIGGTAVWVRGADAVGSWILSHEVGHALGLYHTHETSTMSPFPNAPCNISGDLVCDTNPSVDMRSLCGSIDPSDCVFNPTAEQIQQFPFLTQVLPPNPPPPTTNIMSYTLPDCIDELTPGQFERSLWALESIPVLVPFTQPETLSAVDGTYQPRADGTHDWVITWETNYLGDPAQDRVYVTGSGQSGGCLVNLTLTPATAGVTHSVSAEVNGSFTHTLTYNQSTCTPKCTYTFQVESRMNVSTVTSSPDQFKVKWCASSRVAVAGGLVEIEGVTPNPTAGISVISFDVSEEIAVRVDVFDVRGRVVRTVSDAERAPGKHDVAWDGADDAGNAVAAGIYYARVSAGIESATMRFTVLR